MRIWAVLPGLLLAALLAIAAPPSAPVPAELDRDWFSISLEAGYSGYAFPLSTPALARGFAAGTGLAWQIAFDHSTVPVRLDITHRRGAAFRGRVEVTAAPGYPAEEDPEERPVIFTREFIVPPSVPTSIMLAPRVCPPSQPGAPVALDVRVYQQGIGQPLFTQQVQAVQLEPAHLYSLHLDAPEARITAQTINPDNYMQLIPPEEGNPSAPLITPELLTCHHYIVPQDHRQLTCLPLAANQFAFVLADLAVVRTWSAEEQLALAQYVLGGGHLCLYHADGVWQGVALTTGAQSAGRGNLLPVAGGAADAETAVAHWLEGELAELVLWLGGSCQGWQADFHAALPKLAGRGAWRAAYGPAQAEGEVLARRPGFMHPLLVYREVCRLDALEPWDYPEFLSTSTETLLNNENLQNLLRLRSGRTVPPAAEFAAATRPVTGRLLLIAGLALLPAVLAGWIRRRAWAWLLPGAAGMCGAVWLWHSQPPIQEQPVRLAVYDEAAALPAAAACRELQAVQTGPAGNAGFTLEPGALVRHLAWQPPGDWYVNTSMDGAYWQGKGGGAYAALSTTTPAAPPALPVKLAVSIPAAGRARIELDTSELAANQRCYLLTPLGWQVVTGGQEHTACEVQVPAIPAEPGLVRLRAIMAFLDSRPTAATKNWLDIDRQSDESMLAETVLPSADTGAATLAQLALSGLMQQPTGFRGINWRQGVLLAPLPSQDAQREIAYVRYCFPLEAD